MATATLPKPGTKLGPCKSECTHVDCNQTRAQAIAACYFCGEPIGYARDFYRSSVAKASAHGACLEEAVERKDARVDGFCG